MKILVIGGGGREHTLCWKLAQSSRVKKIFCAPGNAGTAELGENVPISSDDIPALLKFAKKEQITLAIVGPEAPLVNGIVDEFEHAGLRVFGPKKEAAMLEGSKAFCKEVMLAAGVPTAEYVEITSLEQVDEILGKFDKVAVKADGLAAGKGVLLCNSKEEIKAALQKILGDKAFGSAGDKVVVEEMLVGEEASILGFCDGKTVKMMVSSQDHKRVLDNDEGLNTGGMGAYSPAPVVEGLEERIQKEIMQPMVDEMQKRGTPYIGILYAGLMINNSDIKVIEFNARFGDPECQCVLPRMKTDLVNVVEACIDGKLSEINLEWDNGSACCVVLASSGYPEAYEKGEVIEGLKNAAAFENVIVFHAGTKLQDGKVLTSGGRVLGVVGLGSDIKSAIDTAYTGVSQINFNKMHFRTDIGKRALER
ncbi:MAG: phosphoribosylamine--glycine ligase [Candidatus Diapherotrites archaeon]